MPLTDRRCYDSISMLRHMRLAVLALVVVGLGCGREEPPRRLTVVLASAPVVQNPLGGFDELTDAVLGNVYQSIAAPPYERGGGDAIVGSWSNPNVYTWDLKVRPGLRYHDGQPVTAADAVAVLRRLTRDRSSPYARFLQDLVAVRELGPLELRVVTTVPLDLMSRLALIPVVPRVDAGEAERPGCGSGPYEVASWEPERILLRRVAPVAPGTHPPQEAEFVVVSDPARQIRVLGSMRPVLGLVLSPSAVDAAPGLGLSIISVPTAASSYIVCNLRDSSATADLRVRRAIAAAVDRPALVASLGRHQEIANDLLPRGVFGYVPGRYQPNPQWLEPDAVPAAELRMVVMNTLREVAEGVAGQLRLHGFRVKVDALPIQEALRLLNRGDYDLSVLGYSCTTGSGLELFEFAFVHGSSRGPDAWDISAYRSPRVAALVDEAKASVDPVAQHQLLVAAGDEILADLPWLPLVEVRRSVPVSNGVRWKPPTDGRFRLGDVDLP